MNYVNRFEHEEKEVFINNVLKWQRGKDSLKNERCFLMKFGYTKPFLQPGLELSLDPDFHLDVGTFGMNAPSKCSVVVIGGRASNEVSRSVHNRGESPS